MRAALISGAIVVVGLVLLLARQGGDGESPAAMRSAAPVHPEAPGPYRMPRRAVRVSTAGELRAALRRDRRANIVLAPGRYGGRPFLNPEGHHLYAARKGTAVLRAGLSLGGNAGRGGALVRGLVVDVRDARRTVDGAAILVWGTGRGVRILDTRLRGNGVVSAGISARQPEGLRVKRVVARRFTDYGVLVDANDLDRGVLDAPFRLEDIDVAHVSRPVRGSSDGRAEACVWVGNTGSVSRVRARDCAWSGLWTGTAARGARFDRIDVDRARTGVYVEHFTTDSTFRRLRIGPDVRVGLNAEWAAPGWDGRPASVRNLVEHSSFESRLVGVYLDEGTADTTVRSSTFAGQSWAAIGDYRGNGNAYHSNDYGGIADSAQPVRTDHLSESMNR